MRMSFRNSRVLLYSEDQVSLSNKQQKSKKTKQKNIPENNYHYVKVAGA